MEALRRYLESSGLNCSSFAARLGVQDSTVWRWIHGKGPQRRSPSLAMAFEIERLTQGVVPASSWQAPARIRGPRRRRSAA